MERSARHKATVRKAIAVETDDITAARRGEAEDPLVHALQRILGTRWTMAELQGVALEVRPPFRAILLPAEAVTRIAQFHHTGKLQPFEISVNIYETSEFVTTILAHSEALKMDNVAADDAES